MAKILVFYKKGRIASTLRAKLCSLRNIIKILKNPKQTLFENINEF